MTHRILTYTGRLLDPFALSADDIDIRDLAHHLAHTCRFGGGTSVFYSVASHSIAVAARAVNLVRVDVDLLASCDIASEYEALRLTGAYALLHDAGEAYIGDMRRPIKMRPEFQSVRDAEARALIAIHSAFNLSIAMPPFIAIALQEADDYEMRREARWLMPPHTCWGPWDNAEDSVPISPGRHHAPDAARTNFLAEAMRLIGAA